MIGQLNAEVAELSATNRYLDNKLAEKETDDAKIAKRFQADIEKLTSLLESHD